MHDLRVLLSAIIVTTLFCTPAAAQHSPRADTTSERARGGSVQVDSGAARIDPKSPGRATAYSLGGTLLLTPVFGTGLILGPSFGHFYADNPRQAMAGIGLRTAGTAAFLLGAEEALEPGESEAAGAVSLVGFGVAIGSLLYDIGTAGNAARAYNERHGLRARVVPAADAHGQVGLAVRVQL